MRSPAKKQKAPRNEGITIHTLIIHHRRAAESRGRAGVSVVLNDIAIAESKSSTMATYSYVSYLHTNHIDGIIIYFYDTYNPIISFYSVERVLALALWSSSILFGHLLFVGITITNFPCENSLNYRPER